MIRRMLVPLDGSALAESILPCVHEIAGLTGAEITLLQVVAPAEPVVDAAGNPLPLVDVGLQDLADLMRAAHDELLRVAQRWAHTGRTVRTQVVVGMPAEEIVCLADGFDLIAMATHGRSGIGRWVYGSVTDKVLRGATTPVLLIRVRGSRMVVAGWPRRIIVPLDGSDLAEHALPLAIGLARASQADLVLTRSVNVSGGIAPAAAVTSMVGITVISLLDQAQAAASRYLDEVAARPALRGLTVETDVRISPAADGILACGGARRGDLIVMSTHGRSGISRWVYGSVADRVLRAATVPVLLVRAGRGGAGGTDAGSAPVTVAGTSWL